MNKILFDKINEELGLLMQLLTQRVEDSSTVELDQARTGRLSRMDAMQQQAMVKASIERAQYRVKLLQAALRRIKENRYGLCVTCEEPINPKRLEIDPAILYCIDCAQ